MIVVVAAAALGAQVGQTPRDVPRSTRRRSRRRSAIVNADLWSVRRGRFRRHGTPRRGRAGARELLADVCRRSCGVPP
jgi:hypothetical protein